MKKLKSHGRLTGRMRTKVFKKKKPKTITQLKKKLDTVFSIYVRSTAADEYGQAKCYTCGERKHWKALQCGHFIRRSHMATRWEVLNCRTQCVKCNVFMSGNYQEFAERLRVELKPKRWAWLMMQRYEMMHWNREMLEREIERYQA